MCGVLEGVNRASPESSNGRAKEEPSGQDFDLGEGPGQVIWWDPLTPMTMDQRMPGMQSLGRNGRGIEEGEVSSVYNLRFGGIFDGPPPHPSRTAFPGTRLLFLLVVSSLSSKSTLTW